MFIEKISTYADYNKNYIKQWNNNQRWMAHIKQGQNEEDEEEERRLFTRTITRKMMSLLWTLYNRILSFLCFMSEIHIVGLTKYCCSLSCVQQLGKIFNYLVSMNIAHFHFSSISFISFRVHIYYVILLVRF